MRSTRDYSDPSLVRSRIEAAVEIANLGNSQGVRFLLSCLRGVKPNNRGVDDALDSWIEDALLRAGGGYDELIFQCFSSMGFQRTRVILAGVLASIGKSAKPLIAVMQAELTEGYDWTGRGLDPDWERGFVSHDNINILALERLKTLVESGRLSNDELRQICFRRRGRRAENYCCKSTSRASPPSYGSVAYGNGISEWD